MAKESSGSSLMVKESSGSLLIISVLMSFGMESVDFGFSLAFFALASLVDIWLTVGAHIYISLLVYGNCSKKRMLEPESL